VSNLLTWYFLGILDKHTPCQVDRCWCSTDEEGKVEIKYYTRGQKKAHDIPACPYCLHSFVTKKFQKSTLRQGHIGGHFEIRETDIVCARCKLCFTPGRQYQRHLARLCSFVGQLDRQPGQPLAEETYNPSGEQGVGLNDTGNFQSLDQFIDNTRQSHERDYNSFTDARQGTMSSNDALGGIYVSAL
jgi:hypothetical protein